MTLTTIKTLVQVEQRFRRDELERTEIATELRLLRERLNSFQGGPGAVAGISIAPHPALTLDATADVFLSLNTSLQILGADQQGAGEVFAGPLTSPDDFPDFRALVATDVEPALQTPGTLGASTTNIATGNHTHAITTTTDAAGTISQILSGDTNGDLALRRLTIDDRLIHDDDPDTYLEFTLDKAALVMGGVEMMALIESTQDEVVINDGSADVDFRVEGSTTETHLFFIDAGTEHIGILTNTPGFELEINGSLGVSEFIIHAGCC